MTDYGHDLLFGASVAPDARQHEHVLALALAAEDFDLDLLTFQDHPYQPGFLDTWTLLSYLAARTRRIGLAPNVANVPLRPPAVLARSAAALDILSDGRVELGLGAGYFLDAIASMGGPRRTPGQHVDALEEAIAVIRSLWTPGQPVHLDGRYYRLDGARPGPFPAHRISIWVGAYRRRMLELTARAGDGWVPSLPYAPPEALGDMTRTLDAAAQDTGRDPAEIRRIYNIAGSFGRRPSGYLQGPSKLWVEQLTELVLEHGMGTFILGPGEDAIGDLRRFAEEVAPAVREAVARERARLPAGAPAAPSGAASAEAVEDQAARVAAQETRRLVDEEEPISAAGRAGQQTLLAVHAHLREELERLREVVEQVAEGRATASQARSHLNQMTMRQNYWTVGAFCASYCRVVATHHAIEDSVMFCDLVSGDASLGPVIEALEQEHQRIAGVLDEIDEAFVAMISDDARLDEARRAVDRLRDLLLVHLDFEEDQLLEPIGRLAIHV
jgi:alkanesulfonate monooxygenase SsuD/methylene tetrahydromethanopterin reductase-like flavin-dependent oxidoreductase (luciferase family)